MLKKVTSEDFRPYGRVLGLDTKAFSAAILAHPATAADTVVYEPSVAEFEALPLYRTLSESVYGGMCFFGTGMFGTALALHLHSLPLLYAFYGVIGGIGLGVGYITPVSTLVKYFPAHRGFATGLAIMESVPCLRISATESSGPRFSESIQTPCPIRKG